MEFGCFIMKTFKFQKSVGSYSFNKCKNFLNVIQLPSFWKNYVKSKLFEPLTAFFCVSEEMSILIVQFLNVNKF